MWPQERNPFAGTEATILTGAINLIQVNRGQVMSKPLTIGFDLPHQFQRFVVDIPADPIHKADPINQTHRNAGAKFDGVPGFALHDGTDMRLPNALHAISDAMKMVRVPPELLRVQFVNHEQLAIALGG